ncbi:MAG: sigma-70 family RNA polymerase sigma factor [Clostridia bacterium]|nr:sigma-70 family RNA polymerase sigma factor [Clostridia bacterium]
MQKNTLSEIFNRIRNNETTAIEILYSEYKELIYGISYSIIKNREASEDIVQNIYLKIVKMDRGLLPTNYEMSWLYSVTRNETINYIKKTNKELNVSDMYEISVEDENINKIIDKDTYNKIINKLGDKDKEIVSLKILGDRKFKEISEILKMPIGTVQWRYYKALHQIKIVIGNIAMLVLGGTLYLSQKFTKHKEQELFDVQENKENSTNDSTFREENKEEQKGGDIKKDTETTKAESITNNMIDNVNIGVDSSLNSIPKDNNINIKIDRFFNYVINNKDEMPKEFENIEQFQEFYTIIERLEFNYTEDMLNTFKKKNIERLKIIIYSIKEMFIRNKGKLLLKATREDFFNVYDSCKNFEDSYKNTENEIKSFFDYYYISIIRKLQAKL